LLGPARPPLTLGAHFDAGSDSDDLPDLISTSDSDDDDMFVFSVVG
jgi:hypothetical protein